MTESFMSYREDFELYRDDAAKDIKGIANASSKGAFSRTPTCTPVHS